MGRKDAKATGRRRRGKKRGKEKEEKKERKKESWLLLAAAGFNWAWWVFNCQVTRSLDTAVRRSISSRPGTTDFGSNNIISISKHSILLIINQQLIFRICLRAFRARQRPSVLCALPTFAAPLALAAPSRSTLDHPPSTPSSLSRRQLRMI